MNSVLEGGSILMLAALTWPAAAVFVALIVGAAVVLAVSSWSVFRTGQTAIEKESRRDDDLESLRAEVRELRELVPGGTAPGGGARG
jgi:hypothetical protein